jgi:hypothetical protein
MRIIDCNNVEHWNAILARCKVYDFYHLATYHQIQTRKSNSQGVLLVYEEAESVVALPLLLRPLKSIEGILDPLVGYYDATSVYGYAGPITNKDWADDAFFARFSDALTNTLYDIRVIAAFSRLHPLFHNDAGLDVGEILPLGETISIDLTSSPIEDQFRAFRKSHRYEIRKARKEGVEAFHDAEWIYYDDFIRLYASTMERVNADNYYFFNQSYFDALREALGNHIHLFVAKQSNTIISGALFTLQGDIVEYHLSGSSTDQLHHAASKLVIDEARLWAIKQGAQVFHLGGGLGSQEDSLFLYKSGFSKRRHRFKIWKHIVNIELYRKAVEQRQDKLTEQGLQLRLDGFFPAYRSGYKIPD